MYSTELEHFLRIIQKNTSVSWQDPIIEPLTLT